ncbi:transglutaminase domain-containing protein, partial [Candidatus Thorarchaeota archaeon]
MSTEGTTRKKMGLTAIISSIFIVATIVWGFYSFILIQSGDIRPYPAHFEYDSIKYWPYENGFAGGNTNWFDNLNYTNLPLDQPLPDDLLDHLDDPVFIVAPADPGQLWRIDSYDYYDGAGWSKTVEGTRPLNSQELISYSEITNPVYIVLFYAEAGATVGAMSLPSLFPSIRIIEDSFNTWSIVDGIPEIDDPSRLIDYDIQTDEYGTLLFSPFITGTTGEQVLVSFEITYINQDIENIQNLAQPGSAAFLPIYTDLTAVQPLSSRVQTAINQFTDVGTNAYETAMAVKTYFQSTFELTISEEALSDRPDNQEITDWFLERGGGLPMDFATAYCVFMRELGIPARIVSGYALGERDAVEDFRTIMVRHMTFWAEVYVPMSGTTLGEWIQVIPIPLPDEYGGGEDPTNTPVPEIELLVFPINGQHWAEIGDTFELGATITVDGVYVTTPDTVFFYDETDTEVIGYTTIGQSPLPPIANISYVFPSNATVDYHTISATWENSYFMVWNTTRIFAVGTPTPNVHRSELAKTSNYYPSEIIDLNINQGLDTHVALWTDIVHVYGVMTVGGTPVNSSKYGNQYIQIMWDDDVVGDAYIDEYGYYEFYIPVDPMNHTLMTIGPHEVWSSYAGDWDPDLEYWRLKPANSSISVVTVYGRVSFVLTVTPVEAYAGAILQYDGSIQFMNGSLLPSGQSVGVFFGTQANTTRPLNVTGGFQWSYMIPLAQPDGTYFARVNFTSPWQYILGNWSISIPINVGSGGSQITLNALPNPLFIGQGITISGYLQYAANSSGIAGQWVDVWWQTDTIFFLGQAFTAGDGYFELDFIIPAGYEGSVSYWANYTSAISGLTDTESPHLSSTIKRYDPNISILATPDPIRLLQTVTIQGVVSLPENASSPLVSITVSIWWSNSTHPSGVLLGTAITNATGGYIFYYQIPLTHGIETVHVWASYTSLLPEVADAESIHEPLTIEATNTIITINEDYTYYYLNETVQLYGQLQFVNGTPIAFQTVYIHWISPDGTFVYQNTTDSNGDYQYIISLNPLMTPGTVNVHVNWTSFSGLYTDALNDLQPPIQLIQYSTEFVASLPEQIYLDEVLYIQGTLVFSDDSTPITGVIVYIANNNGTHYIVQAILTTNATGGFNHTFLPHELDTLSDDFLLFYASGTNLISDAYTQFNVYRIQYQVNLEISVLPNPVMQNGTLTIHAYLYFAHNSTPLIFTDVDIYWYNGTVFLLGTITTDGTGQGDLFYSGMAYDTVRTGIEVYGYYDGTTLRSANESGHIIVTLQQWTTELIGINTDATQYRLTETVIVTGTLQFASGSAPYTGVTVELYLSGVSINSTITASDGSFTLYWFIEPETSIGFYDLEVRFTSSYPWIAGTQAFTPQIEVYAPGYLWSSFTVNPESPSPLYILEYLSITGTVTWDNSTPYAFSDVTLYWGDPASTYFLIATVPTDGLGVFSYSFQVPADTLTGNRYVWAYIPPQGYATSGTSPLRTVFITTYSVIITATVDISSVHLGEQIIFSGTALYSNGTPLTGYQIEIWWHGELLNIATVNGGGNYSFIHSVPYSLSVGVKTGYAFFNAPTAAFEDVTEFLPDVTVREYIYLFLDSQPPDIVFLRGESIIVTGYVLNDDGLSADGVLVSVLMNGESTGATGTTGAAGTFSIAVQTSSSTIPGEYIITITSLGLYHDILSSTGSWTVEIFMNSVIYIQTSTESLMPGETFSVLIQLNDDNGNPLHGANVRVLLDTTQIALLTLTDASGASFNVRIPDTWTESGTFAISVEYLGGNYVYGDSDIATDSIHVFTGVTVVQGWLNRVNPGSAFSIQAVLNDPNGNPIIARQVLLNLNETNIIPLVTDSDGRITYDIPGLDEGSISFTITLISNEVSDILSGPYTILIQTQGGFILQGTDLIIAGILLIGAVIAVLAYLYIVKGMFRSVVISRGIDIP